MTKFHDPEHRHEYAAAFLDSWIATQIKVLREQRNLTQEQLASILETRQSAISRLEDVNYSKWNITTLKALAQAFDVRLSVRFETFGSLLDDAESFNRAFLQRAAFDDDPEFIIQGTTDMSPRVAASESIVSADAGSQSDAYLGVWSDELTLPVLGSEMEYANGLRNAA